MIRQISRVVLLALASAPAANAQSSDTVTTHPTPCANCVIWNAPQRPFTVYGNTHYVGTHGLSAILVTSSSGHVLIDGGLAESAPLIADNIRTLGFRVEDVKLIVNSHDHYDHAGGIAELQRRSGAVVAASPSTATVFRRGTSGPDDPQFGLVLPIAPIAAVRVVADGETLRVGGIELTAHFTGGHTPGGTSWSWRSCDGDRCRDVVYADSQAPVSADDFYFTRSTSYPTALRDFEKGFATLEGLPCDILLTPHPDVSGIWERLGKRDAGANDAFVNPMACKDFVAAARKSLAARVARERSPD